MYVFLRVSEIRWRASLGSLLITNVEENLEENVEHISYPVSNWRTMYKVKNLERRVSNEKGVILI